MAVQSKFKKACSVRVSYEEGSNDQNNGDAGHTHVGVVC